MTAGAGPVLDRDDLRLRPTRPGDLDFVLALEHDSAQRGFIGIWTREQHEAALCSSAREHLLIERAGAAAGYLITYDLRALELGVYLKRIVVATKSQGTGRRALHDYAQHALARPDTPFLWLAVFADNLRAQRTYRALGFDFRELDAAQHARLAPVETFGERTRLMFVEREGLCAPQERV